MLYFRHLLNLVDVNPRDIDPNTRIAIGRVVQARYAVGGAFVDIGGEMRLDAQITDIETRELERITRYPGFDGFPMFSHDGKRLVFASNRLGKVRGETNVFIADFVPR